MDDQPRLFRLAPEALTVAAHFEPGRGWTVALCSRRGDETWAEADRWQYSCLTTPEAADVIEATLRFAWGL